MFFPCSSGGCLCHEQHSDRGKEKMQKRRLLCFSWIISMVHCVQRLFVQAGERLLVDVCTHCECTVENGAMRKYRLSCRRISCPTCPMVTVIHHLKPIFTLCIHHYLSSSWLTSNFSHPSLSFFFSSLHFLLIKLHDDSSHCGVYYR